MWFLSCQELSDVRKEQELTVAELSSLREEFRDMKEKTEQKIMAKEFEVGIYYIFNTCLDCAFLDFKKIYYTIAFLWQ